LWQLEGVELMTCAYAAEEATLNLAQEDQRARLAKLLQRFRMTTAVAPLPPGVKLPGKDQPILQAAIQAQATRLLTGDKQHFGPHFGCRLGDVLVLSPAEYFERRRRG
jgi:predicted nucleic acid-binding protein